MIDETDRIFSYLSLSGLKDAMLVSKKWNSAVSETYKKFVKNGNLTLMSVSYLSCNHKFVKAFTF